MQRSVYKHIILDTIAASGGDINVTNRHLYINGLLFCKFDDVRRGGIVRVGAVQSETAGVVTFTVASATPAYSTVYALTLTQVNPTDTGSQSTVVTKTYQITTPVSGTLTPTTVAAQFRTAINADTSMNVVATGSSTLIVTAKAGYPILTGAWYINPDSSTVVQTTQGVATAGAVANMLKLGVTTTSNPPTGGIASNTVWASGTSGTLADTYYDLYYFESFEAIGEVNTLRANQGVQQCLWVGVNATNRAAFESIFTAVLGGFLLNGTSVNYHELEVKQYTSGQ